MIERLSRSPWTFAGAFVAAALLGAALFALLQSLVPGGLGRDQVAVERVVRNYLLEHPEILPEAMERLQAKEVARADAEAQKVLAAKAGSVAQPFAGAWAGNPNGDVTVVAFMDYNCGYCRASLPAVAELIRRDPKVRVVYREYPVLGEDSVTAARWALAAAEQGKFPVFHDSLFAAGRVSAASIAAAADRAGIDKARAAQALESAAVAGEIDSNHKLGTQLNMTGTPAWVVGKRVIHGAQGYDELAAAVAEARKGG
jgi:protein-disulfide isomerase